MEGGCKTINFLWEGGGGNMDIFWNCTIHIHVQGPVPNGPVLNPLWNGPAFKQGQFVLIFGPNSFGTAWSRINIALSPDQTVHDSR